MRRGREESSRPHLFLTHLQMRTITGRMLAVLKNCASFTETARWVAAVTRYVTSYKGVNKEFILRSIAHILIKNRVEMVELFRPLWTAMELNNPHNISGPQTTHLDCLFFYSMRVILNICAFLSLFTVVIHAADPLVERGDDCGPCCRPNCTIND